MKRRAFLQSAVAGGAGLWLAARGSAAGESGAKAMRGFVVSDAHFGWNNPQQPAPEVQRQMLARIVTRFPDLDVFIDTGDAHHGSAHGSAGDTARANWTEIIAEAGFRCPFHYVTGNHDGMSAKSEDSEWRCARLGSLVCRPYYSFTIKGIHFVSLPQLMRTVYLNRESLEWLALDLDTHANHTTLILSHNNIQGTTGPFEPGYRGLVNPGPLLHLLNRHGAVAAWMHGHNHNYEVVKQDDRLYVSNGRIGGFDPSRKASDEPHGLGGIYFELDAGGLTVRSWSAEREAFLDELGIEGTHAHLDMPTSFDGDAAPQFCYGVGGSRHATRVPVYHHVSGGPRAVFARMESDATFNDDPDIAWYMARHNDGSKAPHQQLMGSDVLGRTPWRFAEPGIRLTMDTADQTAEITVPQRGMGEACYYPVAPGQTITLDLTCDKPEGPWHVEVVMLVHDRKKRLRASVPLGERRLSPEHHSCAFTGKIPDNVPETIHASAGEDNTIHVMFHIAFRGPGGVLEVRQIRVYQDSAADTEAPELLIDGTAYQLSEGMTALPPAASPREVVEIRSPRRLTWLIRVNDAGVQTLNAPLFQRDGRYVIGPLRNPWSSRHVMRVQAVPFGGGTIAFDLSGVSQAEIQPLPDGVVVQLKDSRKDTSVTVRCHPDGPKPSRFSGAEGVWSYDTLQLTPREDQPIRLYT